MSETLEGGSLQDARIKELTGELGGNAEEAKLEDLWAQYEKAVKDKQQFNEESLEIYPAPGFVVKTWELDDKQAIVRKVFVNVCSEPSIGAPVEQQDEANNETKLRIPISCGAPRELVDPKSQGGKAKVLVFDVVFNPATVAKAAQDQNVRQMISEFALQNLVRKHDVRVSTQMKWPKMRFYKGNGLNGNDQPRSQRIRKAKPPQKKQKVIVEEVLDEPEPTITAVEDDVVDAVHDFISRNTTSNNTSAAQSKSKQKNKPTSVTPSGSSPSSSTTTPSDSFPSSSPPAAAATASTTSSSPSEAKAEKKGQSESAISSNHVCPVFEMLVKPFPTSKDKTKAVCAAEFAGQTTRLPQFLVLTVQLEGVESTKKIQDEVHLTISNQDVLLTAPCGDNKEYYLYRKWPYTVDDDKAKAKFDKKKKTLKLTMHVTGHALGESAAAKVDWRGKVPLRNALVYEIVNF
jgi:hypothetical protein